MNIKTTIEKQIEHPITFSTFYRYESERDHFILPSDDNVVTFPGVPHTPYGMTEHSLPSLLNHMLLSQLQF